MRPVARYRRQRPGANGCLGVLFIFGLVLACTTLIYGWALMIAFGITHAEFGWPKAGVGFWPCVGLGLVLGILTGVFRSAKSS